MKKGVVLAVAAVAAVAAGTAVAVLWSRRSSRRWNRADLIVRALEEGCATPVPKLWEVADAMAAEMEAGLATEGGGSLRMLVAPPELSLPTGDEQGSFYGLELNHTKIRMMWVKLGGKDVHITKKKIVQVPVPSNLMIGTSEELYDYMAAELAKFISLEEIQQESQGAQATKIGVTISFPIRIEKGSKRTKVEWTRGFSVKNSDDKDAALEIKDSLKKHGIEMHPLLVNDTIGTLAGGRYCSVDTSAAVILGAGTNAAYVEHVHPVHQEGSFHPERNEKLINMEWGNFQTYHLPVTEYDVGLDDESPKPGKQIFEKLISGMYLGDIVRRVLLKLAEKTHLFGETVPTKLRIPFVIRTSDMASMHQDTSQDLEVVGEKLLNCLGIPDTTLRMRELVVEVCDIVAKRGARLAGAGIVAILKKLGRDGTDKKGVVVVEGGLYEHYRLYREYLHNGIKNMLQGRLLDNVVIQHFSEGSFGTALLAAANSKT